ncbi:MAG: hypothetical protein FWE07_09390 [Turicibacter sp.]|nr:hypothetical protein [Turicibacter sp.]
MEKLNDIEKKQMKQAIIEESFMGRAQIGVWKKQIVAVIAGLLLLSATTYAVMMAEGLDFFRDELETTFIDLITTEMDPVYAEDQGIRFEVVGIERMNSHANSMVLLYFTMQDVTGQERFSLYGSQLSMMQFFMDDQEVLLSGMAGNTLYFDESTNTLYFEVQIRTFDTMPDGDVLEIVIDRISFGSFGGSDWDWVETGEWRVEVAIGNADHPVVTVENIEVPSHSPERPFLYHDITVTPFGVHLTGTWGIPSEVLVEMNDGELVHFVSSGGSSGAGIDFFFTAAELIRVEEVAAVIFDGYRIAISE